MNDDNPIDKQLDELIAQGETLLGRCSEVGDASMAVIELGPVPLLPEPVLGWRMRVIPVLRSRGDSGHSVFQFFEDGELPWSKRETVAKALDTLRAFRDGIDED